MNPVHHLSAAIVAILIILSPSPLRAQNLSGDEALSKVLIDGEDWQLVAEGFGFTDGACSDADGNFYFMDLGKGTAIQKISSDGKVTDFITNAPKCSGLKFGPDGRLYACTQGPKKQLVAIEVPTGKLTVLADNVQPNDLVVSHKRYAYFTETGKGQVNIADAKGNVRVGATGINAPNGITLSPDQGTLAVSEYRGTNVWVYRVNADGSLDAGARYMELRTPVGKADSGGDGSTTDALGRYYVTSHLGIQMFDSTGRLGGVIAKPSSKGCVSIAFAGPDHEYLYACASDKIFRRKTRAKGVLFFKKPAVAQPGQ
jgi:enterochelin esterase family protein